MPRFRDFDRIRISRGPLAGREAVIRPCGLPMRGMRYVANVAASFDADVRLVDLEQLGKADAGAPERDDANFCAECEQLLDLDGYDGLCSTCADEATGLLLGDD